MEDEEVETVYVTAEEFREDSRRIWREHGSKRIVILDAYGEIEWVIDPPWKEQKLHGHRYGIRTPDERLRKILAR